MKFKITILLFLACIGVSIKNSMEVKYEAEDAFQVRKSFWGKSRDFVTITGSKEVVFTVNVPSDAKYPVTMRFSHGNDRSSRKVVSISANGIKIHQTEFQYHSVENSHKWRNITEILPLRKGLNTLAYKIIGNCSSIISVPISAKLAEYTHNSCKMCSDNSHIQHEFRASIKENNCEGKSIEMDYIIIHGGEKLSPVGATTSYVEYEAEKANTNGETIGPNHTFTSLPSEASGRLAVRLTGIGKYVEFVLTKAANGMVLRYSIPDASNGGGIDATLGFSINGKSAQSLSLTSSFGWFYGNYPFTNNPKAGKPHHFYDEIRVMFGSMLPTGTKLRLQVGTEDKAPWYIIDLVDMYDIPSPYTPPANYVNIMDYGADPTGVKDSSQAVDKAIADAKSKAAAGVWLPTGNFTITRHIMVDDITIRGAGPWWSILHGKNVGVYGSSNSKNVHLYDFAIFGEIKERNDGANVNGLGGAIGGGSVIQNLWIEHTKCGGWFDGPFSDLLITGVTIRDTTADGINLHRGVSNVIVEQSVLRNTGDDGLAMWAQSTADQNNIFRFNNIGIPILANNIAIYGGKNNSVIGNFVYDTLTQGGGIHVGIRFNAVGNADPTTITGNTMLRAGCLDVNWKFGVGALWFYALNSPMSGAITAKNNTIQDAAYEAIQFVSENDLERLSVTNVKLEDIQINGAGTFAVQLNGKGSAQFTRVRAHNLGVNGIYDCEKGKFKFILGPGNSGWNGTQCAYAPTPPPTPAPPTPPPTPIPPHNKTVISINAGGNAADYNYVADVDFNQGTEFSDTSSKINISRVPDWEIPPQAVLQTCRWSPSFAYNIPNLKANAAYSVRLHWAELSFTQPNNRKFNVAINNKQVLNNFDVFAVVGHKVATIKTFDCLASNTGNIVISFTEGSNDHPFISGLEILER